MQRLLSFGLVLTCAGAVTLEVHGAPSAPVLDPSDAAVLPVDADLLEKSLKVFSPLPDDGTILNQCSRATPAYRLIAQVPRATAPPTQTEIAGLEADLGTLLSDRLEAFRASYPGERVPQIDDYYRQYSAFDVGGWRVIYVNGFDRDLVEGPLAVEFDWRKKPAVICDGGEYFFGVEYYPATKTFTNFEFNGRYEGRLRLVR